jgi:hypothetical protein
MGVIYAALPALVFTSLSALPAAIGIFAAMRHLRAGSRSAMLRHLVASAAAGLVALGLLWSSLFGDSLSKSSTAALIFAVAPFYAAGAQAVVYALAALFLKESATRQPISLFARLTLLVPLLVLAVLMVGLVKSSFEGSDSAIAERASSPDALRQVFNKSRTGQADAFGIPLHLAQNPDVPVDILIELAKHDHPAVRSQVAGNPATPPSVVASLRYDCASFVRKAVVERLGPENPPSPAPAPTGKCALARWR